MEATISLISLIPNRTFLVHDFGGISDEFGRSWFVFWLDEVEVKNNHGDLRS